MKKKCENCRHHCFGLYDEHADKEAHHCRRNAPAHIGGTGIGYDSSLFPVVRPDMCCGEWEQEGMYNVFSVVITANDPESAPWISVFSTPEKANAFMVEAQAILKEIGRDDEFQVVRDSGAIDEESYLDCVRALDARE